MLDKRYIEKGIVSEVIEKEHGEVVHLLKLTKLGHKYMLGLFTLITVKHSGESGRFDLSKLPGTEVLPKNSITEMNGIMRFNKNAIRWTEEYLTENEFNESVYDFAVSMGDSIFAKQ